MGCLLLGQDVEPCLQRPPQLPRYHYPDDAAADRYQLHLLLWTRLLPATRLDQQPLLDRSRHHPCQRALDACFIRHG